MDQWYRTYSGTSTGTNSFLSLDGVAMITTPNEAKVTVKKEPGMPVNIFFQLMKKKMGILANYQYEKRIKRIEAAVQKAQDNGQVAFSEELMQKLFILMREAEMYAAGYKIYLDKDVFDRFKSKTKRPVALTALKNYARPIPDDVLQKKAKCDKLKLFDGYFVMHYDDNKTVKETEVERVKREKDPILFGRIEYSPRLYFVADWEDEYCDLTLDDIISTLDLEDEDITLSKEIVI